MSACCDDDEPDDNAEHESPARLWQVTELRWAAAAGLLLLASLIVGWSDLGRVSDVLAVLAAATGGWTFVPGTLRSLRRRKIGVGTLMTMAGLGALALGQFQEAAALAFLFSISEGLEELSLARAQRGLRSLLSLLPGTAIVRRHAVEQGILASQIRVGETLVVRPGGRIATDGTIRSGRITVDMAAITGESIPVGVQPKAQVYAGSINGNGALESKQHPPPPTTRSPASSTSSPTPKPPTANASRTGSPDHSSPASSSPPRSLPLSAHSSATRTSGSNAPSSNWSPLHRAHWRSSYRSPSPPSVPPASSA